MAQSQREVGPSLHKRALQLEPLFKASAKRYGIDPRIMSAVCFIESRYRLDAVSPKGARGPMQFMPETARRYGLKNPHDPREAIDAGARYLHDLLSRFNGRLDLALAAYNAGEGTVKSYLMGRPLKLTSGKIVNPRGLVTGGLPPYAETQKYVNSILRLSAQRRPHASKVVLASISGSIIRNSKSRDFSLDVNEIDTSRPLRSKTNSSFIEVD